MKTVVCIFAHPDDEAMGPSGTIATLAKENPVYIICLTNGDAAKGKPDLRLAQTRKKELLSSAKILGVTNVFFLNYGDGTLSNNLYHEVAGKIEEIVQKLKPYLIITFEPRGVSGHIDHIFASMVSSFIYEKKKYIKEIWYHCISETFRKFIKGYFIYFPPGYKTSEIDKIVYVGTMWDKKKKAMLQHKSQIKDVLGMLAFESLTPKEEYFLVKRK